MKHIITVLFVSIVIFQATSTWGQSSLKDTTLYGHNPKKGHYFAAKGFKMYYELYGKGKPLLFIHGNGGSIKDFRFNIPYFAQKYQVIAVDSRAHGKSVDASDSLSFEMMADDFNDLLESLHLDSCYVIGWSDGGINGLLLAMRHPDKVKKLAITGANLWADTTGLTPFVYNLILKTHNDFQHKKLSDKEKNELKLDDLDLYQPNISLNQLSQVRCPTLVIGGDHDAIPVKHTVDIAQSITQSYLWIIPNSGHSTPIYKRNVFNKEIQTFFTTPFRKIEGFDTFK